MEKRSVSGWQRPGGRALSDLVVSKGPGVGKAALESAMPLRHPCLSLPPAPEDPVVVFTVCVLLVNICWGGRRLLFGLCDVRSDGRVSKNGRHGWLVPKEGWVLIRIGSPCLGISDRGLRIPIPVG